MTDKTYTLDDFLQDLRPAMQEAGFSDNDFVAVRDCMMTRPRFREGEVIFESYLEDDQPTGEFIKIDSPEDLRKDLHNVRPLTLSEMPAAVEELRSAVDGLRTSEGWSGKCYSELESVLSEYTLRAAKALAAFDEVIKP